MDAIQALSRVAVAQAALPQAFTGVLAAIIAALNHMAPSEAQAEQIIALTKDMAKNAE